METNTADLSESTGAEAPTLLLYEEILLLALKEEEGTFLSGPMYGHALGGAIIAELALAERIGIEESRKKHYVNFKDATSTEEPVLDDVLKQIRERKKRATVQTWIMKISGNSEIKHASARRLCELGILREDMGKVLFIFNRRIYPEVDPVPERAIVKRIRDAVLTTDDQAPIDGRTATLIALAHHSGLLKHHIGKRELKAHKSRIENIINGDLISDATKGAIQATTAAIMVCCMVPAITAATT